MPGKVTVEALPASKAVPEIAPVSSTEIRVEPIEPLAGTPLTSLREASAVSSPEAAAVRVLDVEHPGRAMLIDSPAPEVAARLRDDPGLVAADLGNGSVLAVPRFTEELHVDLREAPSLGKGAFGQAFKYTHEGREYAVKIPNPGKSLEVDQNLQRLQATGLVPQYFGIIKVKHPSLGDQEVNGLVMEIGQSPFDIPEALRSDERFWLTQVDNMDFLRKECRRLGITDNDIKPENMLFIGNRIKRIDFDEGQTDGYSGPASRKYALSLLELRLGLKSPQERIGSVNLHRISLFKEFGGEVGSIPPVLEISREQLKSQFNSLSVDARKKIVTDRYLTENSLPRDQLASDDIETINNISTVDSELTTWITQRYNDRSPASVFNILHTQLPDSEFKTRLRSMYDATE